jgi:hypothetical protein
MLTGETSRKHINVVIFPFLSVRYFIGQHILLEIEAALPIKG